MGYIQTRTTLFSQQLGIKEDLNNYKKLVLGEKMEEMIYSPSMNNSNKILCAGHYHFSLEHKLLINEINKFVNFKKLKKYYLKIWKISRVLI